MNATMSQSHARTYVQTQLEATHALVNNLGTSLIETTTEHVKVSETYIPAIFLKLPF